MRATAMGMAMMAVAGMAMAETAAAQPASQAAREALAPTGTLRAAINYGNPVLAQRGADGQPLGVSAVLATALARRLGVKVAFVPFDSAGGVTSALGERRYDIAFMAVDPKRGEGLRFTAPYVLIEGGYVVREGSAVRANEDVDKAGTTIAVATGSAYDLFLSREIRRATLTRSATGDTAAGAFLARQTDVLAGVKSPLAKLVEREPGLRLLPGRFMAIEQAMAVPRDRDQAGVDYVSAFLAEAKADGTVKKALEASGQADAEVAP